MAYEIRILPSVLRDLGRLSHDERRRIAARIDTLALDPRPHACRKLRTMPDCYRIRVGPYRVIYQVKDTTVTVTVVRVRHRREAYR